jgi:hypothetical protein
MLSGFIAFRIKKTQMRITGSGKPVKQNFVLFYSDTRTKGGVDRAVRRGREVGRIPDYAFSPPTRERETRAGDGSALGERHPAEGRGLDLRERLV